MDNLLLGTAGWSYSDWVGVFYPQGLPASDFLAEYARHFRVVEVDSTFYGTPRPEVVRRWADSTPDDFLFCPKMVRTVTHDKQLVGAEGETDEFLATLALLGPKLGPVVLQFDYTFAADRLETLDRYLEFLPVDARFAVEIRNRGWLSEDFYRMLADHQVALVLQDLHYMPRVSVVTTDFTYVRWLGRRQDVSRFDRVIRDRTRELTWWAERVNAWLSQGIRVYAFANNRYQGHAPATIESFLKHSNSYGAPPHSPNPGLRASEADAVGVHGGAPVSVIPSVGAALVAPLGPGAGTGPAPTRDGRAATTSL